VTQRLKRALVAAVALAICFPAGAEARVLWSVRGAGWGHGVGLSQWGTYGYAQHGFSYRQILAHYFKNTQLGVADPSLVRVLLQPNRSTISFTGATRAGDQKLNEASTYKATRDGANVVLRDPDGKPLRIYAGYLPVSGGSTIRLFGNADNGVRSGLYRGSLAIQTAVGSGLNAINTLPVEQYLLGVVPAESPPIWPAAALQAQAVAARSYALATNKYSGQFDQFADTRSQMYRGFTGETAATNNAVGSTSGQVLTYGGQVVVTYFFSTSGGKTENVENIFSGSSPKPWLRGVNDPYDGASPYHRWGPYTWSRHLIESRLGSFVQGRFKGVDVLERGVSPRIVKARVRGSRGNKIVSGPQLRIRLGLRDSWFSLRRVSMKKRNAEARTSSGERKLTAIYGTVSPVSGRFLLLQRRAGDKWAGVAEVPLEIHRGHATYSFHIARAGLYRVVHGWAPGPVIKVPQARSAGL
jgi:stage II sporulation protein D